MLHDVAGKGFTIGLRNCCAFQICTMPKTLRDRNNIFINKHCTTRELGIWLFGFEFRFLAWKRMRSCTCYQNGTLLKLDYKNGSNFVWTDITKSDGKKYNPTWLPRFEKGGIR